MRKQTLLAKNVSNNIAEASENLKMALSAFEQVVVNEKFEQDEKDRRARKRLLLKLKTLLKDLS
ncbi:MAG: hypothetical protein H6625_13260 [Bdellovibrionaceae bacterium]|nr:hypothetical protein [Pseudobdellovibrionaceae bacterium]